MFKTILHFFWDRRKSEMTEVLYNDYFEELIRNPEKRLKSFNKAWEIRDFEISLYWKRAAYFWAFQVASFTGYFAILNSESYNSIPQKNPQILYFVTCIGLYTSVAWNLINKGSKAWQRNWEFHIDILEDYITGPLYKTVVPLKTYSVSKINVLVSYFFTLIWFLLIIKYFEDHITVMPEHSIGFDYLVFFATIGLVCFLFIMFNGYGRGRFKNRKFKFYRRSYFN